MKGLSVLKNIIWALCIVVCLVAVAGGLIFSAFTKYSLPEGGVEFESDDSQQSAVSGVLHAVPETADGGQSYVDSLTFLVDSSLIGIREFGLLPGGTSSSQIWGSSAGNIPANNIADPTIRLSDGSEKTVSQVVAQQRPGILVISLGMDSLQKVDQAQFEANYTSLINSIRSACSDTKIIVCSLCSLTSAYSGSDGITIEMVKQANEWVQNVCRATGVFYADVASVVNDTSGTLLADYAGVNNKVLNSAGINKVLEYLRCHTVS